ncbi:BQ5605_C004g02747 [Microbotryum silenes-dioicae]|uniref:BQ5605_C004g02747 protein n=1 Tax=Microbotryum silenes-dioicae TaxID=796604 RepID=A0A2X0MCU2_9BASI|nr:BQ5605_C004g02747 [Microbotryum silenes-dioicae]
MWLATLLVVKQLLATKMANVAKSSSTRATKRRKGLNDNVTASDSASTQSFEVVVDGTKTPRVEELSPHSPFWWREVA